MRASARPAETHLSGAERVTDKTAIAAQCRNLLERALAHERGEAAEITITIEPLNETEIIRLDALPVQNMPAASVADAWALAVRLLEDAGIPRAREAAALFPDACGMRGAMILDADSLLRLDPCLDRGVRVSRMDAASNAPPPASQKNHFREALILATKAASAPGIVAEICVSDDPGYQTGYVASKKFGYVRISPLKEPAVPYGGRIFFFREEPSAPQKFTVISCIRYLQRKPVLVNNVPSAPPPAPVRLAPLAPARPPAALVTPLQFGAAAAVPVPPVAGPPAAPLAPAAPFAPVTPPQFGAAAAAPMPPVAGPPAPLAPAAPSAPVTPPQFGAAAAAPMPPSAVPPLAGPPAPLAPSAPSALVPPAVPVTPPAVPVTPPLHAEQKQLMLKNALDTKKRQGFYRIMRCMESAAGPMVRYKGRKLLMLASNNYLNLANDPRLRKAARIAGKYGWGAGGSRLTTGTTPLHRELEKALAAWKGTESALLFNTGYMANAGTISALCFGKNPNWTILSDEKNHASIIDGCRLSKARVVSYRHNDMNDLEEKAAFYSDAKNGGGGQVNGLIVSDSVFSMDGDIVDLPRFTAIAERYGFFSMIDEAHGSGCVGETGRGVTELFGLKPDIITGTCSKALGSEGGFVCGSRLLIDFFINHARSFIFATAPPPPVAAATLAALKIIQDEPERVRRLQANTRFFYDCLCAHGLLRRLKDKPLSAIVPIVLGGEETALAVSRRLRQDGFFIPPIRHPTVPKGAAMLRATVCSGHTEEQLEIAAEAISRALQ